MTEYSNYYIKYTIEKASNNVKLKVTFIKRGKKYDNLYYHTGKS